MRFFGAVAALVLMIQPAGALALERIEVSVEPASITTTLGSTEEVKVTVRNGGASKFGPIAVHIDITDPTSESSVDPEDWTPTLTREISSLEPGEVRSLKWDLQPISSGSFSLYAVVLAADATTLAASNVVTIDVQAVRTLNPEGVLPVAIAMPLITGGLLAAVLRRSRSSRRGPA